MDPELYMRSVEHAAELAGGYGALAMRLGVPEDQVVGWAQGTVTPETTQLLLLLDLIILETRNLSRNAMAFGLAEQALAKARSTSRRAA